MKQMQNIQLLTLIEKWERKKSKAHSTVGHIELGFCLKYFILKEINIKVDILTSITDIIPCIMAHKIKKKTVLFTR